MGKLTFLNHASFAVETNADVLLVDPWFEGNAFQNSWALLDGSTSNSGILNWLKSVNKNLTIWYSHEHSDHFSVSFIKSAISAGVRPRVVFQRTLDCRVASFLRGQGLEVNEVASGKTFKVASNLAITTWAYSGGDSYCIIECAGFSILNLNDCVVPTIQKAEEIKKNIRSVTGSVSVLLTQFGYANWVGNEKDRHKRMIAAQEKHDRIYAQIQSLDPAIVLPFASFVYFCHRENFYLNDMQNGPLTLRESARLKDLQDRIFFMKPHDSLHLAQLEHMREQLRASTHSAEAHWERLRINTQVVCERGPPVALEELRGIFSTYRDKIFSSFFLLPHIFELLRFIRPIRIRMEDISALVELSYLKGIRSLDSSGEWHMSMSSEVLAFLLKTDFGFNTTLVSGRFRLSELSQPAHLRFFSPQEFRKHGFGVKRPVASFGAFMKAIGIIIARRMVP